MSTFFDSLIPNTVLHNAHVIYYNQYRAYCDKMGWRYN